MMLSCQTFNLTFSDRQPQRHSQPDFKPPYHLLTRVDALSPDEDGLPHYLSVRGDPLYKVRWSREESTGGICDKIYMVTDPPETMNSDSLTSEVQLHWRRRQIGRPGA